MSRLVIRLTFALLLIPLVAPARLFSIASGQGDTRRDAAKSYVRSKKNVSQEKSRPTHTPTGAKRRAPKPDSTRQFVASPAEVLASRAKDYLIKKRGVDASRIVIINGGYREKTIIELWVIPEGARPPFAAYSVKTQHTKGDYLNNDFITYRWMNVDLSGQQLSATLTASSQTISPCPASLWSPYCPSSRFGDVKLKTEVNNSSGAALRYSYSVTGGKISGEGPEVTWELGDINDGTYTATVKVEEQGGSQTTASTSVSVKECSACYPYDAPCPSADITCPVEPVGVGTPVTFTAIVRGGDPNVTPTYKWTVSEGAITSGQDTNSITIDTRGLSGSKSVTATLSLGGLPPECSQTFSCTTPLGAQPIARLYTQYGNISLNEEKRLLDNFYILLQNEPESKGYIIAYNARPARTR